MLKSQMDIPTARLIENKIKVLETERDAAQKQITQLQELVDSAQAKLYPLKESRVHLAEILRLASLHFPRLRNQKELTSADYIELEKWVRRAKTMDGLKSIVVALKELGKYYPHDIKSNLYALVQKIIIEGPKKA